ncbi:hypothetical protein LR48_Vigan280s000800 [Vigna angularis]|uniref:Uncharacterized protein n=1 Tax=Phaseolus angularis TaxID=3914 RepID=A0A0L9T7G2_PHAAN|nr:hypothetical protein LR48_Vigan280s000800 [Vigna angularis]
MLSRPGREARRETRPAGRREATTHGRSRLLRGLECRFSLTLHLFHSTQTFRFGSSFGKAHGLRKHQQQLQASSLVASPASFKLQPPLSVSQSSNLHQSSTLEKMYAEGEELTVIELLQNQLPSLSSYILKSQQPKRRVFTDNHEEPTIGMVCKK